MQSRHQAPQTQRVKWKASIDGKGVLGIGKERGRRKNVKNKVTCVLNEAATMGKHVAGKLVLETLAKAPNLGLVPAPTLIASRQDCMKWRDTNGTMTDFTVKCVWEALRPRGNEVPWFHIVWFSHAIPRHAFQLWLIMRRSLKTQDKLRQWDVDPATDLTQVRCSLCGTQADSHEHLFFECSYSSKVWSLLRGLVGMDVVPPVLENIITWFQPLANKRTVQNIMGKILFVAATYLIWLERNNNLFKRTRRSLEKLRDAIVVMVRLKLVTFRFKNKAKARFPVMYPDPDYCGMLATYGPKYQTTTPTRMWQSQKETNLKPTFLNVALDHVPYIRVAVSLSGLLKRSQMERVVTLPPTDDYGYYDDPQIMEMKGICCLISIGRMERGDLKASCLAGSVTSMFHNIIL
ncbi:reverse transcriptase domain, reverse transcriptase zinc-binding domain protein [Tanacetum coccineum]